MADLATSVTVMDACGRAGVPANLVSDPGMGKSSAVRALGASLDVPVETVIGSQREPQDVAGYPTLIDGSLVLAPPAWAARLVAAGTGIVFLDELTTAAPAVQAPMLTIALDRVVGETPLPSAVRVIAGCNPPESAAGGYELTAPLANRFCHIDFAPSVDEWIDGFTTSWAAPPASRAVAGDAMAVAAEKASVAGFIRSVPEILHRLPGDEGMGKPWPSRRSWAHVAAVLAHLRSDDDAAIVTAVTGLVGDGAGAEYVAWRAAMDLPDPAAVVDDPSIMDWTARPDRVWTVLSSVTAWATGKGTKDAWVKAWGPLTAAASAGAPDVAGAAARALVAARPVGTNPPASARVFAPMLEAAGLGSLAVSA